MRASTKAKLDSLTNTVTDLYASQEKKSSTIKWLIVGIAVLAAVVVFIFVVKRRKR